jgi:hypothetical protein
LRARIRDIATSRVRYGYRKVLVLLRREGWQVGKYLVCRLYEEERLALKKRPPRRRKALLNCWFGSVNYSQNRILRTTLNYPGSRFEISGAGIDNALR